MIVAAVVVAFYVAEKESTLFFLYIEASIRCNSEIVMVVLYVEMRVSRVDLSTIGCRIWIILTQLGGCSNDVIESMGSKAALSSTPVSFIASRPLGRF